MTAMPVSNATNIELFNFRIKCYFSLISVNIYLILLCSEYRSPYTDLFCTCTQEIVAWVLLARFSRSALEICFSVAGCHPYFTAKTPSMLISSQGFSPRPRIPKLCLFVRHLPNAKTLFLLPSNCATQWCRFVRVIAFLGETTNRKQMLAPLSRLVQGLEQSPVLEWVRKQRICSSFYSQLT